MLAAQLLGTEVVHVLGNDHKTLCGQAVECGQWGIYDFNGVRVPEGWKCPKCIEKMQAIPAPKPISDKEFRRRLNLKG